MADPDLLQFGLAGLAMIVLERGLSLAKASLTKNKPNGIEARLDALVEATKENGQKLDDIGTNISIVLDRTPRDRVRGHNA